MGEKRAAVALAEERAVAADRAREPLTAVVVRGRSGPPAEGCITALAAHGPAGLRIVVALEPDDPSAEVLRAHAAVDRVVLATDRVRGATAGRALWSLRHGTAIVLDAQARPTAEWFDDLLTGLERNRPTLAWVPTAQGAAVALDVEALCATWWPDGLPRIPDGDGAEDVWRWVARGQELARSRHLARPPLPAMADLPYDGLASVVVCSHARPDDLARALDSLRLVDDPCWELIVVDNGSVPQYDPALVEAAGGRYVHEPRRGLDHARNRGWVEAGGEVVAYLDDDCEVRPGWLAAIRRAMGDPGVAVVAGRVVPASLARPTERWFEAWFGFDRGLEPDTCSSEDPRPWAALYPSVLGTGANMAFRREALAAVGGFDELLDVGGPIGGGGDIDAFARVLDTGMRGRYAPDAVVAHHHRRNVTALRRQFFGYGQALGAVCTKYALDRPGHKRAAVRFYRERLRDQVRRAASRDRSTIPRALTLLEVAGQVHGPIAYLWARWRRHRAHLPRS